MTKQFLVLFIFVSAALGSVKAQIIQPASWSYEASKKEVVKGETLDLIFKVNIDPDWYLYSTDFDPDCGPMVTTFNFEEDPDYELVGEIKPIGSKEKYDEIFECDYTYFRGTAEFRQTVKILDSNPKITGKYEYQVCTDVDGRCIPFDDEFSFNEIRVEGNETPQSAVLVDDLEETEIAEEVLTTEKDEARVESAPVEIEEKLLGNTSEITENKGPVLSPEMTLEDKQDGGIGWFMILSFLAGLAALLTPCVFPMIPMTVTYFTGKSAGTFKAFMYGLCIILIYTVVGSIIAPLMGPETANHLSTEWLPNLIFFIVFVVFALSFFGLFEITLPHSFVNKVDRESDRGGLVGVFFMAFTLVLVSFSCTGPIVGSILVESAGGQFTKPILGMFSFSAAFAVPFTLFAIFPGWLSNLPKSGGWLNSVKVVLGFLELAFAFKFLSIADQAFHWGILDREVNIAIWIVIFTLMGFYLLGKIRLPKDSPVEHVGVGRLMLAIATFSFVVYLVPGMWGAPLKPLAGYLPPLHTHDFNLLAVDDDGNTICDEPKYGDFLHLPHGLKGYFDYDQAIACARAQDKPLFIDFTGHGCTNCREMEARVWSNPEVLKRLRDDYVIAALYVDDKTKLPESEWYVSSYDDKMKKTIGKQNADLQITNLNNNAQPFYVLVGNDEQVLVKPKAYDLDPQNFVKFLEEGKKQFRQRHP